MGSARRRGLVAGLCLVALSTVGAVEVAQSTGSGQTGPGCRVDRRPPLPADIDKPISRVEAEAKSVIRPTAPGSPRGLEPLGRQPTGAPSFTETSSDSAALHAGSGADEGARFGVREVVDLLPSLVTRDKFLARSAFTHRAPTECVLTPLYC